MTFTIISNVLHKHNSKGEIGGYGPYVREMNLWLKHVDKLIVVAPIQDKDFDAIDLPYLHNDIHFVEVPSFDFTSVQQSLRSLIMLPVIFHRIMAAMRKSDHIHLRCPSNMGLLGCVAQVFFPKKKKTAKYAGNWDWASQQPRSYRWQQRLLQNTCLTKNMTALVYGTWPDATINIKPFFTASYSEKEIVPTNPRSLDGTLKLVFIGGLYAGKRPLVSVQTAEQLHGRGHEVELNLLGEGKDRDMLEQYIEQHDLKEFVHLRGNVNGEEVKQYVSASHFLVFASMSEGWPKAVAESMFWGCVPLTSRVSCVAEMLGDGERGTLVNSDAEEIANTIEQYLKEPEDYQTKAQAAMDWSRQYTLEKFEEEITKLI